MRGVVWVSVAGLGAVVGCDDPCRLPVESMAVIEVAVVDANGAPVDAEVTIDGDPCEGSAGSYTCGDMLGEGTYVVRATDGGASAEEEVELEAAPGECHPDGVGIELVL